jgi:hypothetical protein
MNITYLDLDIVQDRKILSERSPIIAKTPDDDEARMTASRSHLKFCYRKRSKGQELNLGDEEDIHSELIIPLDR